jgi:hypothetical protein
MSFGPGSSPSLRAGSVAYVDMMYMTGGDA